MIAISLFRWWTNSIIIIYIYKSRSCQLKKRYFPVVFVCLSECLHISKWGLISQNFNDNSVSMKYTAIKTIYLKAQKRQEIQMLIIKSNFKLL